MKKTSVIVKSLGTLVVFLLIAGILFSYFNWSENYKNKIYPGIRIGSLDLSGKGYEEAQILINQKVEQIIKDGLYLQYENKKTNVALASNDISPDSSYQLVNFDVDETMKKAFSYNKPNSYLNYLKFKFSGTENKQITSSYDLDRDKILALITDTYKELNIPPENASFSVSKNQELEISPEQTGKEINYELALSEIKNNLDSLDGPRIILKTHSIYPDVKAVDLNSIKDEAKKIINQSDLKLIYVDTKTGTSSNFWVIRSSKLLSWLSVSKNTGKLSLSLDQEKIKDYLLLNASPSIDIEALRPRFNIENGKVSAWQKGTSGQKLNLDSSASKISQEFLDGKKEIVLVVEEVLSEGVDNEDIYNIKEIIGTGHSNFVGSPTNRRKNIQVGANSVDGILLAPGEEFSLVKALGDVSEESGYFPELVIKDNKTIPEYGGGLCQVATTLFRSALASGLPITARRNHSYRVSYYEPAGTDAAIYIPNPDVKFVNDTGNYILIQSRIVKNDIYFDFWGTKDGRIATTSKPIVYNIVKPAPTKYIETTALASGQKKCTENAHNGADAYFDYKVIYPEGSTTTPVQERRFSSHYVPWQEVCLIGKGASSTTSVSSSTPKINTVSTSTASTTPKI